jgi:hypothetical protein
LLLLEEEMHRALEFCWWRAQWWVKRADTAVDTPPHIAEGQCAYALEQSLAKQQRAVRWATRWTAIRERAQTVLRTQLLNVEASEASESLPELLIEIDDEEDRDVEEEREADEADDEQ